MPSFKLDKSDSLKDQILSGGALLLIIAIIFYFLVWPLIGVILGVLGLILLLAGLFAKEEKVR